MVSLGVYIYLGKYFIYIVYLLLGDILIGYFKNKVEGVIVFFLVCIGKSKFNVIFL